MSNQKIEDYLVKWGRIKYSMNIQFDNDRVERDTRSTLDAAESWLNILRKEAKDDVRIVKALEEITVLRNRITKVAENRASKMAARIAEIID